MLETTLDDHGFRVRGAQPSRVDAFVDAAFAFAVTLLVIAIGHVPASIAELVQAMRGVPAFAASFFVIARLWQSHRHWSRRYGIEDAYSVRLSLALVFIVLVYVYPLRMVAELTFAALSGGALTEGEVRITSVAELQTVYVVFGLGYGSAAIVFNLLYRHAAALADAIGLSVTERIRTRTVRMRWQFVTGVALLSSVLALVLPMGRERVVPLDAVPGLVYLSIFIGIRVLKQRERAALAAAGAPEATR
jgi:uncharacterized membrane protein